MEEIFVQLSWNPGYLYLVRDKKEVPIPKGWDFLPSGDSGLTRRVKSHGKYWVQVRFYRNHPQSMGGWAPADVIASERQALEEERSTKSYQKKLEAGRQYRVKKQADYVEEFKRAVVEFLDFAPRWQYLAEELAVLVAEHSTPVGSGTVARTSTIPIEQRAEAAVIAWMRHQTTNYDRRYIDRFAGERHDVRRELAEEARAILKEYRRDYDVKLSRCPLAKAIARHRKAKEKSSSAAAVEDKPKKGVSRGGKRENFFEE